MKSTTLTILICFMFCGSGSAGEGLASYYTEESCRREGTGGPELTMSNGKRYDESAMTCALWIVGKNGRPLRPTGSLVRITNVESGLTIVCAWTDNGPGSVPRSRGVIVDLTPAAFLALGGKLKDGRIKVKVERI